MTRQRKVIVALATSADGYVAGPNGELEWLTSRPKPKGFYGMGEFAKSVDVKVLGRKTYEAGLRLGGKYTDGRYVIFSRRSRPADAPANVEFVSEAVAPFMRRLRAEAGKDIWLMGGGDIIASFLDAGAIDEFIISVNPVFIGDGIPLLARRHRQVELELLSSKTYEDGVVQNRYRVR